MGLYWTKKPIAAATMFVVLDLTTSNYAPVSFATSPIYAAYLTPGKVRAVPVMAIGSLALGGGSYGASYSLRRDPDALNQFRSLTWKTSLLAGFVNVAGNDESSSANCWEEVLGKEYVDNMEDSQRAMHRNNGMLLQDLIRDGKCTLFKSDDEEEMLIVRNASGNYFAFSITETVKAGTYAEYPNKEYDVTMVHAVPIVCGEPKP